MQMRARLLLLVNQRKEEEEDISIFDIWSKSKVVVTFLLFIDLLLLSLSIEQEKGIHAYVYEHFSLLFSLSLVFFNPTVTTAILDSVVYPSFFFFFMCV